MTKKDSPKKTRAAFLAALSCLLTVLVLAGCTERADRAAPMYLGQLTYSQSNSSDEDGYTIYLEENGALVPYFVLSDNYGSNTLLLRRELLEISLPFNENGSAYYFDSDIDRYLCSSFLSRFSEETQRSFRDSAVTIGGDFPTTYDIETVSRKVFLLSSTEICIKSDIATEEGSPLSFFLKSENRIARRNGQQASWGLRSTYTAEQGMYWCVAPDGTIGGGAVQSPNGVRPALSLSSSCRIDATQLDDGTIQYTLSNDQPT